MNALVVRVPGGSVKLLPGAPQRDLCPEFTRQLDALLVEIRREALARFAEAIR